MTVDLDSTGYRPWPIPRRPWALHMMWHDLLFAHWPVAEAELRRRVPPSLEIDTFEGTSWIGLVPFHMTDVRPRLCPIPFRFAELNVRTYVLHDGKPGVWFFSLDAAANLVTIAARFWYRVPYLDARIRCDPDGPWIDFESTRRHRGHRSHELVEFHARYRPIGDADSFTPGSFERWSTERYCLYSSDRGGRLMRGDIHHAPWQLQPAELQTKTNTMLAEYGVDVKAPPHLVYAKRMEIVAWNPSHV